MREIGGGTLVCAFVSASLGFPGGQLAVEAVIGELHANLFKVHFASIYCPKHIGDLRIGPDVAGEMKLSLFLHRDVL